LFSEALFEFDQSIMKYPNIERYPGGASTDLIPDLQHPQDPVPALKNLPKGTVPMPN
jgi:arylsulfatase